MIGGDCDPIPSMTQKESTLTHSLRNHCSNSMTMNICSQYWHVTWMVQLWHSILEGVGYCVVNSVWYHSAVTNGGVWHISKLVFVTQPIKNWHVCGIWWGISLLNIWLQDDTLIFPSASFPANAGATNDSTQMCPWSKKKETNIFLTEFKEGDTLSRVSPSFFLRRPRRWRAYRGSHEACPPHWGGFPS